MHTILYCFSGLFIIVSVLYFAYIIVHLISWSRLPFVKTQNFASHPTTKISVIIAARNEETTIERCLQAISKQEYPINLFELIVVDDHSEDATRLVTEKILSGFKITCRCITNHEKSPGKKGAIKEAILNSTAELIVITDADSMPEINWLSTIETAYRETGAYMLCGPVKMDGGKNIIEKFQSLELCGLSFLAGAGINMGYPLLCNGANLAYTRKVFQDVRGFEEIDGIPSGDDILLMFKVHKMFPGKVSYVKSQDAIVSTTSQPTLKDFISQRIRWASKGFYSKNNLNSLVGAMVLCSNLFCLISIFISIAFYKEYTAISYQLSAISLMFKLLADFLLLFFATLFFKKQKLLWIFPLAEIITMLYISWVGIAANFKSFTWKGRSYKPRGKIA